MRLLKITGVDLSLFEFDYDLTWAAFFMNADGRIYGRYGGRDAKGPDTRNTLAGLRYAMEAALEAHRVAPKPLASAQPATPDYIERYPSGRQFKGCIHCHYIKEIRWAEQKAAGRWNREEIWAYPLPENVGLTLDMDRGNVASAVTPGSAADKAGLKKGDVVTMLNDVAIHAFADAQYALHKAPAKGHIPVAWRRGNQPLTANLTLADGWRKTNITWRPSVIDLLPSLRVFGADLSAKEKRDLGLDEKLLAFRQEKPVHYEAKVAGIKENDVILGLDNLRLEMSVEEFLGYVRRNYLIGDVVTMNIIRDGKRVDLKVKLK